MILYRPVGTKEYGLIQQSDFKKFPPRLPEQPIFYPVLNEKYACEIAETWNTKDSLSGFIGYVLKFIISDEYISKFEVQTVGASYHQEYWIPAEELDEFNASIIGMIEVIHKFDGGMGDRRTTTTDTSELKTMSKEKCNYTFFENTILASRDTLHCTVYDTPRSFDWCEENCPKYSSCDTIAWADDELKLLDGEAWECPKCGNIVNNDEPCWKCNSPEE